MVVVSEWFYISQVIFPAKFGFDKKVVWKSIPYRIDFCKSKVEA